MDQKIFLLANELGMFLRQRNLKIAVAESCTGGAICQAITEVPGSSQWFDRGFITYSNQSKIEMLGVKRETLEKHGAVSAETVVEMLSGTLTKSAADCAIAVSGIAGPGGGTKVKPVGTVFIGWQLNKHPCTIKLMSFEGDRTDIRRSASICALTNYNLFENE